MRRRHVLPVQEHLAGRDWVQPRQQPRDGALATAALSHQRQDLTPAQREADILDGVYPAHWAAQPERTAAAGVEKFG